MFDLDFIKAKIAKLTPGPWSFNSSKGDCKSGYEVVSHHGTGIRPNKKVCVILPLDHEEHGDCNENIPSIVQLVVSAPTDLAALVAEVERLRGILEEHRMADRLQTTEFDDA